MPSIRFRIKTIMIVIAAVAALMAMFRFWRIDVILFLGVVVGIRNPWPSQYVCGRAQIIRRTNT